MLLDFVDFWLCLVRPDWGCFTVFSYDGSAKFAVENDTLVSVLSGLWTLAFRSEGHGQKEKEEKKYGKRMLTVNARLLR